MASILIIDDDATLRELLEFHLGSLRHSVRGAGDAAEAIRLILDQRPDLILSDVNMPYMSGLELLKAIRGDGQTKHIPVVFLTARDDDTSWVEALKLGVSAYVTKPVKMDELVREINQALLRDSIKKAS